jgi:hypothetical protein
MFVLLTVIIIIIIIIIISGTTARTCASRRYYDFIVEVSANEEQVASLLPQRQYRISLIQQPEPSGSEAREPRVRSRVGEVLPTKRLTMLCRILLRAVNPRHGTDGFTSPPKEVRATDFYHP